MNKKAIALVDEHFESLKNAGVLVGFAVTGWAGKFLSSIAEESHLTSNLGSMVTILAFIGGVLKTLYIFSEWRDSRARIAMDKKAREEEAKIRAEEVAKSKRIQKNNLAILEATTGDEIHKILARNAREKRDT